MKTVAFIFHDTNYYSGGTRSLLDLIDTLLENRIINIIAVFPDDSGTAVEYITHKKISVIFSKYYQISYFTDEGFLRYVYRFPKRIYRNVNNWINAKSLSKEIQKYKVDAIYSNTGFIITGALIKKYIPEIKHVWHLREFGEEDHHFGIFFGRKLFYYLLNRYTDEVIFISRALEKKFKDHIYTPKITVVYDDVSKDYLQESFETYERNEGLSILMAGLICEGKGQIQAIEAVKILKSWNIPVKLYIAGECVNQTYKRVLENYIFENQLEDRVHFIGMIKDMNELRRKMKFGIVASASEAFGRVTIEGMLSGLLMIGAEAGATKELIEKNNTGMLYEWGNSQMLAEVLKDLYENPDNVNEIRINGKKYSEAFTKGNCAKILEKIFLTK